MSDSEDEASLSLDAVFTEPPRPPTPEPTIATYTRTIHPQGDDWSKINIRLVGSHPLWGHHLWNASRAFATFLETHRALYAHRSVLELGAGGGLPGIVAALNGAANVILTDYPDAALLENLHYNVSQNVPDVAKERIHVEGYIWGHNVAPLFKIQSQNAPTPGFDLIIMSDLVFNHSQHDALLKTAEDALARPISTGHESTESFPDPCVLVFYTHHRPHLAHRDMEFFEKATKRGWICQEILTQKFPLMFPDDSGDEEVRSTVHGWKLMRPV
ncbi:unnamed protein product [Somion occarium]|uniref:Protein N-terminal and lysine N-methyltransferase EFM7 n=1 Tax=Somion occarium TaxID=3059160 RepID=A0ABP1DN53_9APHY